MDKVKLLIVEDIPAILRLYEKGLGTDIFETRTAPNGEEALEIYDAWSPEVIVLDIMMPVMSGFTVLQTIREDRKDNRTVIVMASARSETGDITACARLGIQGYIVKPFKFRTLEATLFEALSLVSPERARPLAASRGIVLANCNTA